MAWTTGKDKKFLVDLQKHTYISDKSHQEIIDLAGLHPGGYDNYLKGWIKRDGTLKIWVETIEDVVFRYWDQMKLAVRQLIREQLTEERAKTYALVNRIERFAGRVRDFVLIKNREQYFETQLGYTVHFYGLPAVTAGSRVMMQANLRVDGNRYLMAGTRGRVVRGGGARAKRLRVKWQGTHSGLMKPRAGVELLTDRRLLTLV